VTEGALPAALLQLAEHRSELDELRGRLADLEHALEGDAGSDGIPYRPGPAPRWWLLAGVEREEALARLAGWVEEIYRPGFGHLAAKLPACWPDHAFCAYVLARDVGWAPPMAWDDDTIDDPAVLCPEPGWRRGSALGRQPMNYRADLIEDIEFLRENGYRNATSAHLAVRLGMTKDAVAAAIWRDRIAREQAGRGLGADRRSHWADRGRGPAEIPRRGKRAARLARLQRWPVGMPDDESATAPPRAAELEQMAAGQ
jgi:hypothetical protein